MSENRIMHHFIHRSAFPELLSALTMDGYACIGPQVHANQIVFAPLTSCEQLPAGWQDAQQAGYYQLQQTEQAYWFNWSNTLSALKPYTFARQETMWTVKRDALGHLNFQTVEPQVEKTAVLGVRACDLAALALQDLHFLQGDFVDPYYQARRESLLLIGVNCTHASETCFCASTGDGPEIQTGYDILLSEIEDGFVVETASDKGQSLIERLNLPASTAAQWDRSRQRMQQARQQVRSILPKPPLYKYLEHSHWQELGERCIACGKCTEACPTCFCSRESDTLLGNGQESCHAREWDSCFNAEHGHVFGGNLRRTHTEYYRQWLTHKLSGWHEQFGRSGCIGCGRCITVCPVEIDLTEAVEVLLSVEET